METITPIIIKINIDDDNYIINNAYSSSDEAT